MNLETGQSWEDLISRHEVFGLWREAFKNELDHSELADNVEARILSIKGIKVNVDHKRLRVWCEQIRRSLVKKLDKERERNPNPTNEQRNAWTKYENMLPRLCHGAKSSERTDYDAMWDVFKNDVINE